MAKTPRSCRRLEDCAILSRPKLGRAPLSTHGAVASTVDQTDVGRRSVSYRWPCSRETCCNTTLITNREYYW